MSTSQCETMITGSSEHYVVRCTNNKPLVSYIVGFMVIQTVYTHVSRSFRL